jgi:hypothetical protein
LALAKAAARVVAYDRAEAAAFCARHNARAAGLADRCEVRLADVTELDLPRDAVIHIDPDRRPTGRRRISVKDYSPDEVFLRRLPGRTMAGAMKLSPAMDYHALADWADGVSDGEIWLRLTSPSGQASRYLIAIDAEADTLITVTAKLNAVDAAHLQASVVDGRLHVEGLAGWKFDFLAGSTLTVTSAGSTLTVISVGGTFTVTGVGSMLTVTCAGWMFTIGAGMTRSWRMSTCDAGTICRAGITERSASSSSLSSGTSGIEPTRPAPLRFRISRASSAVMTVPTAR